MHEKKEYFLLIIELFWNYFFAYLKGIDREESPKYAFDIFYDFF